MKQSKALVGWCLFDVANSAYTTLIITVAFNVIFTKLIVGPDSSGSFKQANSLWALLLAASWGTVAVLGPWLGSLSDARGWRKNLLLCSVVLCCGASTLLYGVSPGQVTLAMILVFFSNIGYSLSENFIAAFLPSVATATQMGKISGLAWGMGYFGGLGSIILVQAATGLNYTLGNFDNLRWVGPLTAVFFLVWSLPALIWLKEPPKKAGGKLGPFARMRETAQRLGQLPDLSRFLISTFFFQGGIAIVISFASIYAEQVVALSGAWQAIFFLSLQLTAAAGSFLFGWLQTRWTGLRALNLSLGIWVLTIVILYFIVPIADFLNVELRLAFVLGGNLAGIVLGATQSIARALVGQFAPEGRAGEVFGLWGFFGKLAMVFALVVFSSVQVWLGLRLSLLLCSLFFGFSLFLHSFVDERRGIARARALS